VLRSALAHQVLRRPYPVSYALIASTWNAHALSCHFTIIHAPDANGHTSITSEGEPIFMGDFLVNAEDCSLTTMNTINSKMQALIRYVAMKTVYSQQKHDADHQQCQTQQLAVFSMPSSSTRSTQQQFDLSDNHHHFYDHQATSRDIPPAGTSSTFVELDFSGLDQAYIEEHISSDTNTVDLRAIDLDSALGLTTILRLIPKSNRS
jgi:hypothetical protein